MSLQHIANTMKAQGRGPDDMLVHMSSREVAGLQGLAKAAGGSLTVNPTTGLPEAGFLDSLLPTLLGAGATFFGGPMAGAAVGALTGAVQNKENPLLGALTGGLGGYGGGQLLSGLNSLGAAGANAATDATMNVVGGANIPEVVAQQAAQQAAPMTMQNLAAGASKAFATPSAYLDAMNGASGAIGAGTKALAPMGMYTPPTEDTPVGEIPKYRVSRQYTGGIGSPGAGATSEKSWFTSPTFERAYAAGGGITSLESGGFVIPADVVSAVGNGSSAAGLEILAQQLGAVPIDGEGDGQSDSIPTTIDGEYPAAVAREEAYLGPQEVARMGGADKLYALMDRIRVQAHGSTEQQRPVV